jgi:hypothetical protein
MQARRRRAPDTVSLPGGVRGWSREAPPYSNVKRDLMEN